jgi:hypothetical protein
MVISRKRTKFVTPSGYSLPAWCFDTAGRAWFGGAPAPQPSTQASRSSDGARTWTRPLVEEGLTSTFSLLGFLPLRDAHCYYGLASGNGFAMGGAIGISLALHDSPSPFGTVDA